MKYILSFFLFLLIPFFGSAQTSYETKNTGFEELIEPIYGPPPINLIQNGTFGYDSLEGWWVKRHGKGKLDLSAFENSNDVKFVGVQGFMSKIAPDDLGTPAGNPPSTTLNLLFGSDISVTKGKTYSVRFKSMADSSRTIDVLCTQKIAPFDTVLWIHNIPLDTTLTTYGSYLLNWGQNVVTKSTKSLELNSKSAMVVSNELLTTDSLEFAFAVGASLTPLYIDDVEIFEVLAPEINIVQDSINITDSTGIYDFGNVVQGESKTVLFTIENTGSATLNLLGENTRVFVTQGNGFSLVSDAASSIEEGEFSTFEIKYEPIETGVDTAIVTIENNDVSEEVYSFTIIGNGEVNTASVGNRIIENPVVNVYPNPTRNHIIIDVEAPMNDEVFAEITDMQGRSLLIETSKATNTGIHSFNWDLKEWNSGIYFVKVSTGSGLIKTCKIIFRE